MQVKLSPEAQERVESLVRDGAYPSVEAAVEAAVAHLEHPDFEGINVAELSRTARDAFEAGQTRLVDEDYRAELRTKLNAIREAKRPA